MGCPALRAACRWHVVWWGFGCEHKSVGQLVEALFNNTYRLPELIHPAAIPVVDIAVLADGYFEIDLVISVVRCGLSDVVCKRPNPLE